MLLEDRNRSRAVRRNIGTLTSALPKSSTSFIQEVDRLVSDTQRWLIEAPEVGTLAPDAPHSKRQGQGQGATRRLVSPPSELRSNPPSPNLVNSGTTEHAECRADGGQGEWDTEMSTRGAKTTVASIAIESVSADKTIAKSRGPIV